MLNHGIVPASGGGYEIDNSLRFNDDDSAYLSRTPSSAGNRKTWTWSGWVKRGNFNSYQTLFSASAASNTNYCTVAFNGDNQDYLDFQVADGDGTVKGRKRTSAKLRDPSAWYHIVAILDTTQATDSNRMKLYLNGSLVTDLSSDINNLVQNQDYFVNNTIDHRIGMNPWGSWKNDGYLAEVHFIDGQALTPADFGETGDYGEWKPTKYTGTYGTNGFYLDFSDSGSLGTDASSNSNNWTPNNLSATDQMLDSPTNNFATLNPLEEDSTTTTFSEGSLQATIPVSASTGRAFSTIAQSTGKWYWEVYYKSRTASGDYLQLGLQTTDEGKLYHIRGSDGERWDNGSSSAGTSARNTTGDVIGIAVDLDNGKWYIATNNTWQNAGNGTGNPTAGTGQVHSSLSGEFQFYAGNASSSGNHIFVANFGQDSSFAGNKTAQGETDSGGIGDFYYTPPTDPDDSSKTYLALCTQNLPEPTVIPSEHFNTVLWTGDGSTKSITGVGFQPDLVWGKNRAEAWNHTLFDAVRGTGKLLQSNLTNAETTNDIWGYLSAFNSDGFTLTAGSSGIDQVNDNSDAYVAWNWKANGGSGVSNTDGSITSTVSANQDAGFSIVSYTGNGTSGATIGHGLSSKPEMLIVKKRNAVEGWQVLHTGLAADYETDYIEMHLTAAKNDSVARWNDTQPTTDVFSVGNHASVNTSSDTYIAYCFHSVDGYSKVGSYTGNGSSDGTFVYTGFRPKYVLIKSVNTQSWNITDTARLNYNLNDLRLLANSSGAEEDRGASDGIDMLSNGFKLRSTATIINSANNFIYIAFAETPFSKSNAR